MGALEHHHAAAVQDALQLEAAVGVGQIREYVALRVFDDEGRPGRGHGRLDLLLLVGGLGGGGGVVVLLGRADDH